MFLYGSRGDGSRGANIDIRGGSALNPGVQVEGGSVQVTGGNSTEDRGGAVTFTGGSSTLASGGGAVGGTATLAGGDGNTTPGNVQLTTQASSNTFYAGGGNINLRTNAYRAGIGPSIIMDHRNSQPYGYNAVFEFPGTPGGNVRWAGLTGDTFANNGQSFEFRAGISANILNTGRGGDFFIYGGNAFGNGNQAGGGVLLSGGTRSGTATKGYVNLERTAVAAPTDVPIVTAGYAPMIFFDDGANLHLYAWCQSVGAWQSVMLA
jgi:hypothetical protein